jgi:hypothetical protein
MAPNQRELHRTCDLPELHRITNEDVRLAHFADPSRTSVNFREVQIWSPQRKCCNSCGGEGLVISFMVGISSADVMAITKRSIG